MSILMTYKQRCACELELRRREGDRSRKDAVPDSFGEWLKMADTQYQWTAPHFRIMQQTLDRVTAGELRFVIFQIPIRHGKTEHNTYRYLTYNWKRNPRFRGLLGTYNQPQADFFSRKAKEFARRQGVIMGKRDTMSEWETNGGGGLRAVGAGVGVASVNADGIVIDDPIGSRGEAESASSREGVFQWITNDLMARMEPHSWLILTMSRWNLDDPVARLTKLMPDKFHVVDLPGVAEAGDLLGRPPCDTMDPKLADLSDASLLWPDFRGVDWMRERRESLGSYGFASLIQGRPRPQEGGMFKWSWWKELDVIPAVGPCIRYWDLAGTDVSADESHDPDYTAGVLGTRTDDGRTAILNIVRFRKSVAARDAAIDTMARWDKEHFGHRGLTYWFENDPGIGGKERTAAIVRRIHNLGITCYTEPAGGKSKRLRAEPLASAAEAGNIYLCPGAWRDTFRSEASDFTGEGDTHDDQIDAAAGMFNKLAHGGATVAFARARM